MTKGGFFFENVTEYCTGQPEGVEQVFEIRAYCASDIVWEYGRRCYKTVFVEFRCTGNYPESDEDREKWWDYEDELNRGAEQIEYVETEIIRNAQLCETGKAPDFGKHGKTKLEKAPRNRETGESKQEYYDAVTEAFREYAACNAIL